MSQTRLYHSSIALTKLGCPCRCQKNSMFRSIRCWWASSGHGKFMSALGICMYRRSGMTVWTSFAFSKQCWRMMCADHWEYISITNIVSRSMDVKKLGFSGSTSAGRFVLDDGLLLWQHSWHSPFIDQVSAIHIRLYILNWSSFACMKVYSVQDRRWQRILFLSLTCVLWLGLQAQTWFGGEHMDKGIQARHWIFHACDLPIWSL